MTTTNIGAKQTRPSHKINKSTQNHKNTQNPTKTQNKPLAKHMTTTNIGAIQTRKKTTKQINQRKIHKAHPKIQQKHITSLRPNI